MSSQFLAKIRYFVERYQDSIANPDIVLHLDTSQLQTWLLAIFGGGEGSRTPVHKASSIRHYERSYFDYFPEGYNVTNTNQVSN